VLAEALAAAREHGADERWLRALDGGMTAVAGTLAGRRPGPVVALRFDLDALPVAEAADPGHVPVREGFASRRPGLMHACGHDGHTAIGLALAARLAGRDFAGTVKLLFQPAEEGLRGARAVAASGIVDDVDELYCLHLGLGVPTGVVHGAVSGLLASTKLRASFRGRAAHAGVEPEAGANALLAAAQAVVALHALPQYAGPGARLNVGTLHAGTGLNIVPERAELAMETRAPDAATDARLGAAARAALTGAAGALGVEVEIEQVGGADAVRCDDGPAARVAAAAARVRGLTGRAEPHADSGSEDAGWLLERVRAHGGAGTYLVVGCTSPSGHHTPRFDLDERALPAAVDLLEAVVRDALR